MDSSYNRYNPEFWKYGKDVTVKQLCKYLMRSVPRDAVLYVEGMNTVFLHLTEDGKVLSLDSDSLADLEEYEGRNPTNIKACHKESKGWLRCTVLMLCIALIKILMKGTKKKQKN